MPEPVRIRVDGRPVSWARAGRSGQVSFTPAPQRKAMKAIGFAGNIAMQGRPLFEGPVTARLTFVYPIPKSWPAWKRRDALAWLVTPTGRPDLDNLLKLGLDALNGIVFVDDAQVIMAAAQKVYGREPHTAIEIIPFELKRGP